MINGSISQVEAGGCEELFHRAGELPEGDLSGRFSGLQGQPGDDRSYLIGGCRSLYPDVGISGGKRDPFRKPA